ncbi:MAG: response regulator [Desulfuromonadaceae bacterium]|nr:response regulator [Desulfuromonadaceae bacterium]
MSIKVLVADDSITIQKVIGIIFGGDEYSLTIVDNGKAAVDTAREINPDILLIDALMPGMSGYEVAEAVRSTPSLAAKPILLLTGSFEPFDEDKAKKCGADDFIAKPFESQQIISKVKELLEIGRTRGQAPQSYTFEDVVETPAEAAVPESVPSAIGNISQNIVPPADTVQTAAAPDIWGAFTPEAEPFAPPVNVPVAADSFADLSEPDVFAIVTEENDAQLVETDVPAPPSPQHTGSQWVPVEENTFEFEDETAEEQPPAFIEQVITTQLFTDPEPDAAVIPAAPFVPLADPTPVLAPPPLPPATAEVPMTLNEEQLKAALASVSKEVIERIVWEVVPDLAEAMIREAIRKIKEGV